MKRYLLFIWLQGTDSHGWENFLLSFDDQAEAEYAGGRILHIIENAAGGQVVDIESGEIVRDWDDPNLKWRNVTEETEVERVGIDE